ncbi:solute carrier family 22 member 6-A-like [Protopterus annectens]|uniref:solute carrier family 22 member 6-A-like n=1 Tax=Protopterus annectens TaxID=7888 RepID=UPI001CFBB753|nr:solute carrier family 22 member 6-A-like [Protopterus annectens]
MGFADLLEKVGSMGRFQHLNISMLALPAFMMASHFLIQNFSGAVPRHHCRTLFDTNDSHYHNLSENVKSQDLLRIFVPMDSKQKPESCVRFSSPQWNLLNFNYTQANMTGLETEPCRDGWIYDQTEFSSTIISEWDLVCSYKSLKQFAQSIFMGGILTGGIIFGGLADRFGRKSILVWSYLQMAICGTCTAFAPSFTVYCIFRFFCGMAASGIIFNCISLNMEWIPTRSRTFVGTLNGHFYTCGQLILAGLAYGIRNWHWLQITVSAPFFVYFLYSWWLPESARWLVLNNKSEVAVKHLKRVAAFNGKKEEGDKITPELLESEMQREILAAKSTLPVISLFHTPAMRHISICLAFAWFSTSFAYYGLAMDLQNFGVSIYLIQVIFGAIDFPAKCACVLFMNYIGRRSTLVGFLIVSGLMVLSNVFVPKDMTVLRTAFAVLGKGGLAGTFTCVYLFTIELYPTVVRQTGMGFTNIMARIGAMIAPMVQMTADYFQFLPLVIYGMAPVLSGIIAYFLPETLNMPLADTVDEVENSRIVIAWEQCNSRKSFLIDECQVEFGMKQNHSCFGERRTAGCPELQHDL